MRVSYPLRVSAEPGTAVQGATALHHDRVVEEHVPTVELGEVRDPFTEQHRGEADAQLVDQSEVERLLRDVGARDRHVLVARDLARAATPASTVSTNVVLGQRVAASSTGRWVTTTTGQPAGWLSPQPSVMSNRRRPEIERAHVVGQVVPHTDAGGVERKRDVVVGTRDGHVAGLVPVEQLTGRVVGVGDEPVERHRHVGQDLAHVSSSSSRGRWTVQTHRDRKLIADAGRRDQPKVKQYASTPASWNSISTRRSEISPGWRISWYVRWSRTSRAVGADIVPCDVGRRAAPSRNTRNRIDAPGAAGPITRLTSRAWKRNAIRPPGSFEIAAWLATVHVPESAHSLRRSATGNGVDAGALNSARLPARSRCSGGSRGTSRVMPASASRPPLRGPGARPRRGPDRRRRFPRTATAG